MNATKDFSKKTLTGLSKKGISVVSSQAIPAFDGDIYFSGVAYTLSYKENSFIRTHSQVLAISASSWDPESLFDTSLCLFCHKYKHVCKCNL